MTRLLIKKLKDKIIQLQEINERLNEQICERMQAEATLRESDERFRVAFFSSPDAVAINRMEDGLFVEINDAFTAVTGYTREETIGKTSIELNILTSKDRARLIAGVKEHGTVLNFESPLQIKDGSILTGLTSATVFILNSVPHILTTLRLIEELKQVEKALRGEARELTAVYRIAKQAGVSLNRTQVVDSVLETITNAIETSIVFLFLRQDDLLIPQGSRAQNGRDEMDKTLVHRMGECLCGLAVKNGQTGVFRGYSPGPPLHLDRV